jgi:hypothetical protein
MAKVLTLQQPYAQLSVIGAKKIETRSFNTHYRGELLIHSSLRIWKGFYELIATKPFSKYIKADSQLILGCIVGKVNLVGVERTEDLLKTLSADEKAFGDYSPGRYGWILEDAEMFDKPIGARGNLGIWNYEGSFRT